VLGPHAPRRIFDVTLDLQLIEPLFRRELSIERYALWRTRDVHLASRVYYLYIVYL